MITLNNPLVLIGGTVLGVGFKVYLEKHGEKYQVCFHVEAISWSYCKKWGG